MANYKQRTTTDKKTGKQYTYYFWPYKNNLGKWKYEQGSTIEALDIKVKKKKKLTFSRCLFTMHTARRLCGKLFANCSF